MPDGNVNPLTGLCDGIGDDKLNRRPVAFMVSNSYDSLPQWGISQADIIYEMLAEGRITRLLAIFQDPSKIEALASIRSARPYFIDIAQSYGAVYMHFGGSVPAYEAIAARGDLISIDGIKGSWEGTLFLRDPDRRKQLGLEHSVYTDGEKIEAALEKLDADLSLTGSPSAFQFGNAHSAQDAARRRRSPSPTAAATSRGSNMTPKPANTCVFNTVSRTWTHGRSNRCLSKICLSCACRPMMYRTAAWAWSK